MERPFRRSRQYRDDAVDPRLVCDLDFTFTADYIVSYIETSINRRDNPPGILSRDVDRCSGDRTMSSITRKFFSVRDPFCIRPPRTISGLASSKKRILRK